MIGTEPLQGLDLVVLLDLVAHGKSRTVRDLAGALEVPKSLCGRSLQRLRIRSLIAEDVGEGRRINRVLARDLFAHGVRWIAPARIGKVTLGLPTAHAAPPLADRLSGDADPLVMPLDEGPMRGRSVTPLHPSAAVAASKDKKLHELLALVDGIRVGGAREREVATAELLARL